MSGSITFNTSQINTEEFILMAKVMVDNGSTVQQANLEIQAINDCMSMMKSWSIIHGQRYTSKGNIRKESSIQDFISRRIDKLVEELHEIDHPREVVVYKARVWNKKKRIYEDRE